MSGYKTLVILAAFVIVGCSPSDEAKLDGTDVVDNATASGFMVPEKPFKSILDYGLFADVQSQTPAEGIIAYSPINENFADYATVRRFIRLPAGAQITYDETGLFAFPLNTVIAQTFSYLHDRRDPSQGEELIETRVMIHRIEGEWESVPYIWNADKTDARRSVAGGIKEVTWIHDDGSTRNLKYLVPNANQCVHCHETNQGYIVPIGMTARNLNLLDRNAEETQDQLATWVEHGILTGAPDNLGEIPRLARWNDPASGTILERSRAFLDVNCSYCHNPNGLGSTSGLDLQFDQDNPVKFGVYKQPVAAGRGSEGLSYSIDPGHPEKSFLIQRLVSTDPSIMMPPLGRRTHNAEAVGLIEEWIAAMSFDEEESTQIIVEQKKAYEKWVEEGEF
jgi:uncharacterized repeat protein (TIGR03806 family)